MSVNWRDSLDTVVDTTVRAAQGAARTAERLVQKGREKADQLALQNRLQKLYARLGALAYAVRTGEKEEDALMDVYVAQINDIKRRLAEYEPPTAAAEEEPDEDWVTVIQKQTEAAEDAPFRPADGDELA